METKFLSNSKGFFLPLEQLSFYQILKFDKKIEAFIDINFSEYYTKFWNEICHKNELNLKAKLVDDSFHESKIRHQSEIFNNVDISYKADCFHRGKGFHETRLLIKTRCSQRYFRGNDTLLSNLLPKDLLYYWELFIWSKKSLYMKTSIGVKLRFHEKLQLEKSLFSTSPHIFLTHWAQRDRISCPGRWGEKRSGTAPFPSQRWRSCPPWCRRRCQTRSRRPPPSSRFGEPLERRWSSRQCSSDLLHPSSKVSPFVLQTGPGRDQQ